MGDGLFRNRYLARKPKMKGLLVVFATLIGVTNVCVVSVGWLLTHPIQAIRLGLLFAPFACFVG
jgi:hypothetical protein